MVPERVEYVVRCDRSRKLWVPRSGWRWPPPRLVQLGRIVACWLHGHDWSPWQIDDVDGPGEHLEHGGFMPYCSRESRPGEFGIRSCPRCSAIETRWPAVQAPPRFRGCRRWLAS